MKFLLIMIFFLQKDHRTGRWVFGRHQFKPPLWCEQSRIKWLASWRTTTQTNETFAGWYHEHTHAVLAFQPSIFRWTTLWFFKLIMDESCNHIRFHFHFHIQSNLLLQVSMPPLFPHSTHFFAPVFGREIGMGFLPLILVERLQAGISVCY